MNVLNNEFYSGACHYLKYNIPGVAITSLIAALSTGVVQGLLVVILTLWVAVVLAYLVFCIETKIPDTIHLWYVVITPPLLLLVYLSPLLLGSDLSFSGLSDYYSMWNHLFLFPIVVWISFISGRGQTGPIRTQPYIFAVLVCTFFGIMLSSGYPAEPDFFDFSNEEAYEIARKEHSNVSNGIMLINILLYNAMAFLGLITGRLYSSFTKRNAR